MSRILHKPYNPWLAFWKGAGTTVGALGVPLALTAIFAKSDLGVIGRTMVVVGIAGGMSLLVGIVSAIGAAVQGWAYDKVSGNPFG